MLNSQNIVKETKSLLIENQNKDRKIITFLVLKNNDNNYLKRLEIKAKNFLLKILGLFIGCLILFY